MLLERELIKRPMPKKQRPTEESLPRRAADLLAARPHFSEELRIKLIKKGYEEQKVDELIKDFKERGYLDDGDRALLYLEELKRKRFGKNEAVRRLMGKGVAKSDAENMAGSFFLENDEIANIRYLLEKKKFNLKDIKDVKKAYDFLVRRGFGWDRIREVIRVEDQ